MRRQRKNKKIKFPSIVKDAKELLLKRLAHLTVIAIFLIALLVSIKAFLYRSDYFRLRVVEVRDSFLDQKTASAISNQLLGLYHGKNVFKIDLKYVARFLQDTYADAKEITAKIVMPDKLSVTMKFRKPVAIVRSGRSYPIDEDGVVLPSVDRALLNNLPVIEGVDIRYDTRRQRQGPSANLRLALELLREIKGSKFISEYGIDAINAEDARNLSFHLANGPEIRIGSDSFGQRLDVLEKTLKDPRLILDRINYIDLRFEDVVIGPK
jgi:cell division septal protein FtsQ